MSRLARWASCYGKSAPMACSWSAQRRFVVVREETQEGKRSLGRKWFEVPGYTIRLLVTNLEDPPEKVWRDYNQRACVEQRIGELKPDLATDDFCLREFFATRGGLPGHSDAVQPAGRVSSAPAAGRAIGSPPACGPMCSCAELPWAVPATERCSTCRRVGGGLQKCNSLLDKL